MNIGVVVLHFVQHNL